MTKDIPQIGLNSIASGNNTRLDLLEYLEQEQLLGFYDFNDTTGVNLISRPYAKVLMEETSIKSAHVGPREINDFGGYLAYGGQGYDRNNTPIVEVRRSSIWEDYKKTEATATAFIDGVGTASPVIANSFMGHTWESRPDDTAVPNIVVWGSGGGKQIDPLTGLPTGDTDFNGTVTGWELNTSQMRTITIENQGKGFEPNSTMAVLHYPVTPFAYWSFDRHETLLKTPHKLGTSPHPGGTVKLTKGFWSIIGH